MDNLSIPDKNHHFQASDKLPKLPSFLSTICDISDSNTVISELCKKFEAIELQLGDIIHNIHEASTPAKNDYQDLYIIIQGRIRLVSTDSEQHQNLSIQLLQEGSFFGSDSNYREASLPYQAFAASEVKLAKISFQVLHPFLAQLPKLQHHLAETIQARQRLIFFKTLTSLNRLPTHKLEQFCSYVVEKKILPGKAIANLAPAELGRFWLQQGQIQDQISHPGFTWGYPETTEINSFSKTELLIYQLSQEDWEAATAIAPQLTLLVQESHQSPTTNSNSNPQKIYNTDRTKSWKRNLVRSTPPRKIKDQTKQFPAAENVDNSQQVDFPKPLKPRRTLWKAYPFIEQQSSSDCGVACLAMISQYWGKRFNLSWLREITGVWRSGTSLKNLASTAESLGYHARPVRASLNRLVDQTNPWIAHWEGDHFIVVYWIKGDQVLVADPAKGKYRISRRKFVASWTGFALLLDPTEQLYTVPGEKRSLVRFFNLLLPYRTLGLQIILASILIQIFGIISPLFTQIILDQIVVSKSQTTLNVMIIGALLFGIAGMGLSAVRTYLLNYFANRLDLTLISGLIRHTLNLPIKFFESRRVGDIITRVQENEKIQQFLIGQVLLSWLDLVTGIIYLCLMLYYNWQLTVLVLAIIPPIIILTLVSTPLLRKISREEFNATADENSTLVEMLSGISTVKSVAVEQEFRWRWEDKLTHQLNIQFKGQKLAINLGVLSGLINTIGGTALLWYGATLVIQDQLTIGQYVAFSMMKGHVISPFITLVGLWDELQEVLISVEKLNDIFDYQPEEKSQKSSTALPNIEGNIRFDNISFRYESEEERNALQNISFEVKKGQTLAIVGRSGSGKSTLVKLLQGLYQPTSGQIWIDGHDLNHLSLKSLRSQLGVVPQECFLFSGTILENITLHQPKFSLEQAIDTAKLAEAHAFIQAFPLGYSTKVGEWGTNLSGGQRQRIAIARALLEKPPILIFDEATSSLDTESERRFQENLKRLARERTTFIIAHRLSTVRNADCIIVLDKGVLVEKGTHEELIQQQGLYFYLAQQQLEL